MCLHYKTPVLLIEFAQGKAFHLGVMDKSSEKAGDRGAASGVSLDLSSKLALLSLTFPKCRKSLI
jgi:hypothetical protein